MEFLSIDKLRNVAEDVFNQAKPKTETEAKLYEVLSHKNWGSSSTLLNDIARDTYDYDKFGIISTVMWESMENQRPAAWRVVFKGLTLLEHLIKNGSERCVDDARNHGHSLRALLQFNYYEGTIDRGQGVREKAKQLIEMLGDDERVREERTKARKLREKFGGGGGGGGGGAVARTGGYGNEASWESGGGGGGGGGYANGGIDARSRDTYSGRYDTERDTRSAAPKAAAPGPTFATLPPASDVKAKKKKKKKAAQSEEEGGGLAPPPSAGFQTDLLDFGADEPAPSAPAPASDGFSDLRSANGPDPSVTSSSAAAAGDSSDDFGAFDSAPTPQAQPNVNTVDPFAQPQSSMVGGFDNFGAAGPMGMNNAMMGNGMNTNMGQMNPMMQLQAGMAGMSVGNPPNFNNTTMMGGMPAQPMSSGFKQQQTPQQPSKSAAAADDEFGDFGAAPAPASTSVSSASKDPLSKLISLDGLSKNAPKVKPDKLSEPIASGPTPGTMSSANMGGVGGGFDSFGSVGMMGGNNMAVGPSSIGMMDPALMGGMPGQPRQPQGMVAGGMGMGMPAGAGGMNYNMPPVQGMAAMNSMSGRGVMAPGVVPGVGGGMMAMNPAMMGGGNPMMMGGMNPGMAAGVVGGGMMNPAMMGGSMAGMNNPNMGVMNLQQQQQAMMMMMNNNNNNQQQQLPQMGGTNYGGNPMMMNPGGGNFPSGF